MKKLLATICAGAVLGLMASCDDAPGKAKAYNQGINIIPTPVSLTQNEGNFKLNKNTKIYASTPEAKTVAEFFAAKMNTATGYQIATADKETSDGISLVIDGSLDVNDEGYTLDVADSGVRIKAKTPQGLFYGMQSFLQLLPAEIESPSAVKGIAWTAPAVSIKDEPRFGYRGIMLDPCRHFIPVENIKKQLDVLALFKINRMHWHLTDDQGWRIEIKKYPKLTEIGSKRIDGEGTEYGGFYTQEEVKDIVKYAADRFITIVPEIELPGHEMAAIAAYPELSCEGKQGTPRIIWGVEDIVLCAGKEEPFQFFEDVIAEVAPLFPGEYFHIGGDECPKTSWEKCPLCQKRMKKQRLANEEDLQGYFMKRISDYLRKKGREVIGWDELTNSSFLPEESIILGWQGMGTAALKAAEKGHRFIMTPARIMYLIRYQGPQWFEPVTYFGNNTLKDVFDYEPVQKDWKPEYESLLMGIQACMWTEFCNKPEDVDYLLFPRLAALAEVAWTAAGTKDWTGFLKRMDVYNSHIAEKGIVYARSMYNIQQTVTPVDGHLEVSLECIRPDVEIYYTLNGSNPAMSSHRYDGPICVTKTQMVKAATFMNGKQMGETLELPLTWNKATAKPLLGNKKNEMLLVNGLRGSLKYTDFEWCNWNQNDSISFTIDLQGREILNKFAIGCITNYGMGAHKPKMIRVEVSDDNRTYHTMGELNFSPEEIYLEGTFRNDYSIDMGGVSARYVRVTAEGAGICPDEHVRPGQEARVYFDEVIIE